MASFQAFHDRHFSHETYKHHASTVTCSESKWKNPPDQNDHSRQKQTTRWKYLFLSIFTGAWVHWQCQSCFTSELKPGMDYVASNLSNESVPHPMWEWDIWSTVTELLKARFQICRKRYVIPSRTQSVVWRHGHEHDWACRHWIVKWLPARALELYFPRIPVTPSF